MVPGRGDPGRDGDGLPFFRCILGYIYHLYTTTLNLWDW